MNWAYGVEFLEIDPKQLGTDKFDDGETTVDLPYSEPTELQGKVKAS
jgi:hypothetical protein